MKLWRVLNDPQWFWRWPIKLITFAVVTAVVLYPKLWLFPTWLERIGNMNSMLDPEHPALADLEQTVLETLASEAAAKAAPLSDARIDDGAPEEAGRADSSPVDSITTGSSPAVASAQAALKAVQKAVYERIPYAWDWETWGVCEYLPTVAEVFEQGREDCDGRAVVAASLLRRMGYDAWLVSDLLHVWVETPHGETMSPTGGEKTFVGTETGTRTTVSLRVLRNLARGLSYGIAVFPLTREVIILATLCLLSMQPWSSGWRRVAGVLLLWIALDTLRDAGRQAAISGQAGHVVATWIGVGLAIGGWLVLAIRVAGRRPRSAATRPE